MRRTSTILVAALVLLLPAAAGADDAVLAAMAEELARTTAQLRMGELPAPYFVSFRVDDVDRASTSASFGSLVSSDRSRSRWLSVELRVGEAALDNTNFLAFPPSYSRYRLGSARLPVEDSVPEIRRQIWLATDALYKQALEDLARKKAALQNRTRTDELPDFAAAEPVRLIAETGVTLEDPARAERLVASLSAVFRAMPEIQTSSVRLNALVVRTRYLNSEGTRYLVETPQARLSVSAGTQAIDGMPLTDVVAAFGRTVGDLPDEEELLRRARELGERLTRLRASPAIDTYNGPVLFEGQAAAELLADGFAQDLLAVREPVAENPQMAAYMGEGASPLADKLGARVLPRFLSLLDDPTRADFRGRALLGGYPIDDEGVLARATTVVENGRLRTLLATRNPIKRVPASTGNRRGGGPAPTNLIVTSESGLPAAELRRELLALAAEAGLDHAVVVRRLLNPMLAMIDDPYGSVRVFFAGSRGQEKSVALVEAVRVYPDGREEPVRGLVAAVPSSAFRDIVAVSDTVIVEDLPFAQSSGAFMGARLGGFAHPADGAPLVSVVTPALLFEELTLKKPGGELPRPPVAAHPFFSPRRN